jgi:hypothetical protein
MDLSDCRIAISRAATAREARAVQVLVQEASKRCGIEWPVQTIDASRAKVTIYAGTRASWEKLGRRVTSVAQFAHDLPEDGFVLHSGHDIDGDWIAILGADERGLLFGVGKLLRLIEFDRQRAAVAERHLHIVSHPQYRLRGHQLGYRPKTNSYDAWTVPMWDQYIRDLALFGTNSIELVPPRSDDQRDSPHFPLPPERMMVEMSRIADAYGLDVWIWYPALDKDYSDPHTVSFALQEWGRIFEMLPRIDAVFVPGGDPGRTEPQYLLALMEQQKKNLRKYHPRGQMWVSPQGFGTEWTEQFLTIVRQESTKQWLDGIVFGPGSRLSVDELRRAVPVNYPIRCYPDITHSVWCQYPVPEWDLAFALTEGREVINPRPESHANILRQVLPQSIGFISYSEGCNDDVNKFVWSSLSWDPTQPVSDALNDYARYFIGSREAQGFAQGLLSLESNWRGPLATNSAVEVTLQRFQDMERMSSPAVLGNWRFQQALFRAYLDAFVRRRLLDESAHVSRARDLLERVLEIGWSNIDTGALRTPLVSLPNGLDPEVLLIKAQEILEETLVMPAAGELRSRVLELGEALFQSIRMQLAVERYQGEAVRRGANLDTVDHPVGDTIWLRRQIIEIRKNPDPVAQVAGIRQVLFRTDPGPRGFYDELGNVSNRPHLVLGPGSFSDPDFRRSPAVDSIYPDTLYDTVPISWKHWVQSQFDAPVKLFYENLEPQGAYSLRVVYSGDEPRQKIRLVANDQFEIHPYLLRPWPPRPQEFSIPGEATSKGKLTLAWTGEPGSSGDGRGCQVAEVWLLPSLEKERA